MHSSSSLFISLIYGCLLNNHNIYKYQIDYSWKKKTCWFPGAKYDLSLVQFNSRHILGATTSNLETICFNYSNLVTACHCNEVIIEIIESCIIKLKPNYIVCSLKKVSKPIEVQHCPTGIDLWIMVFQSKNNYAFFLEKCYFEMPLFFVFEFLTRILDLSLG